MGNILTWTMRQRNRGKNGVAVWQENKKKTKRCPETGARNKSSEIHRSTRETEESNCY